MESIIINLPNTEDFYIAIDERGIILEGRVDPVWKVKPLEIFTIYSMTGREIDKFYNLEFPESYFEI